MSLMLFLRFSVSFRNSFNNPMARFSKDPITRRTSYVVGCQIRIISLIPVLNANVPAVFHKIRNILKFNFQNQ